jgi:hypothetical protein
MAMEGRKNKNCLPLEKAALAQLREKKGINQVSKDEQKKAGRRKSNTATRPVKQYKVEDAFDI